MHHSYMIKEKKKDFSLDAMPPLLQSLGEECTALFAADEISRLPSFKTRDKKELESDTKCH